MLMDIIKDGSIYGQQIMEQNSGCTDKFRIKFGDVNYFEVIIWLKESK